MRVRTKNTVTVRNGIAYIDVSTKLHPDAFAQVDEADLDAVLSVDAGKWWACNFDTHILYACATRHRPPEQKICLRMHRIVLGLSDPRVIVDHVDGDGLNNTRANLRFATRSQNAANSRMSAANRTGFRGVSANTVGTYTSQITHNSRAIFLGNWDDPAMAAAAYDGAARALFGRFAKMNFRRDRS